MAHPAESFREATRLISKSPNSPFGIENLRGINPPLPPFHKGGGRVLKSPLLKGDLGGLTCGTNDNPPRPPFHKGGENSVGDGSPVPRKPPLSKGDLGGFFNGDLGGLTVGEGLVPSRTAPLCHSRERGNPNLAAQRWIPDQVLRLQASGMTNPWSGMTNTRSTAPSLR
jgi:hypothetical protein